MRVRSLAIITRLRLTSFREAKLTKEERFCFSSRLTSSLTLTISQRERGSRTVTPFEHRPRFHRIMLASFVVARRAGRAQKENLDGNS